MTKAASRLPSITVPRIIVRKDARALGLTRYYNGKPCPHGHVTERLVSNGTCLKCLKDRTKAHTAANRDKANARDRRWRANNPEATKAIKKRDYENNKELRRATNKKWLRENRDRHRAVARKWRQENRPRLTMQNARRRQRKKNASVAWADNNKILAIYEFCALLRKATGEAYEVDHIIPLQGKNVCGLHVEANLGILPSALNARKGNRINDDDLKEPEGARVELFRIVVNDDRSITFNMRGERLDAKS